MSNKKKKKGLGSAGVQYVNEQKPKTVYSGSGIASGLRSSSAEKSTNYQSSGGIGATGTSTVKETATQRAERKRSNQMRSSALVSIAKTMAKNSSSTYKTTLPSIASRAVTRSKAQAPKTSVSSSIASRAASQTKAKAPKTSVSSSIASRATSSAKVQAPKSRVVNTIAKNALAPVNKYAESHMVTGGHGVGTYGFKTSVRQKALAPAKEIAEYTRKQQNKYVYTPNNDYRFDAKGNMLMKKDPISIEYGNKLRAGMPSASNVLMSFRSAPTDREMDYRTKYGFDKAFEEKQINERLDNSGVNRDKVPLPKRVQAMHGSEDLTPVKGLTPLTLDDFRAGFADQFAAKNVEDTGKKQFNLNLDDNTLAKLEAQRQTGGYAAGMLTGQAAQYLATRGLLGTAGLVGKSAEAISDTNKVVRVLENRGVKTGTAKAWAAFMQEAGIDQAASVPLNLMDAMKADGAANIIRRFGFNQGLDLLFSGLFEIPSLRRNMHFLNGNEMNEAANAMQEGTEKLSMKIGAKGHLDTAVDETGDVARQEAVQISMFNDNGEISVGRMPEQPRVEQSVAETPRVEVPSEPVIDTVARNNADSFFGRNNEVPTIEQISDGTAMYGGLPVKYDPNMSAEASNFTTEIRVSNKFFDLQPDIQRHVLNHEVAHNYADDLMSRSTGRWKEFSNKFIKEKNVPVDSVAYRNGQRTYWEGLYGDIGATSLSETVTRAFTEYLDNPNALRSRSVEAFEEIDNYMRRSIDRNMNAIDVGSRYINEIETPRAEVPQEPVATPAARATVEEPKVEVQQEKVETTKVEQKVEQPKAEIPKEPIKTYTVKAPTDEELDRLVREQNKEIYNKMSTDELQAELRWLGKNPTVTKDAEGAAEMGIKEAMEPDEIADRVDVINEILAERGVKGTTNKGANPQPKSKVEEPKAETASKEEVFVSEEQVDKVFNDAIRKRSYRFETLRAYPRSGDMRIIIGDRAYDERGFRRLIREDLERTKAQVNEAINARAAKAGKQKASVEQPKAEPKPKEEPKAEPKTKAQAEQPKAKAEDTRTWQEKAKADFYESSKNRAKDVKKGKIPSKESGETVNAIKRLKETTDFSDIKDTLDRGVKDGLYNRKIRHLDEEMDKAMKEIEEDPEKVINDILEYHPNGAKGADIPADAVPFVMKGYALCKWADQNGMKALKEDIAATMAKAQSAGGSVLRAGQVFTVMADSHTQRDIVADFVEKMQTKYAKRLGDHKLSVPEDLLKKLDDATTDAEKSKALDDISVHVWNQVPQSFFDAFSGLRIISMLANTTTMIRNVASNVAFTGVREVDKTLNTMMEATAEKLGKIDKEHRTHSVYNHFSKENRKIKSFWDNDYKNNSNIIKGQSRWDESGGALNVDFRHEDARHYGVKAGGGKKGGVIGGVSSGIEAARKVTTLIMDKGDEIFLRPAYSDAATQLMHARGWGIDDLTPARIQEIREYATDVAQKATYRDPSDAAMALAKWGHWQKGDGGFRLARAIAISGLQPFKKTPINIGKRSVEYSPLGFVKGVWDIGAAVHAGDSKAVNKAITELSHGTTGTGLVVAGYLLAQQGLVNAKLPSDDEGYLRKDLGEQDYALTLNGKSRTLQWAAPGAVPILAGATLYDQIRQRGWNSLVHPAALVSVLSESTNPLLEMSFMQSYMDIADVTDDVEGTAKILVGLEQIGLSYAAQFIPTALGKLANVFDPVRRDTSSQKTDPYEKAVDRFIKKSIINKIPNVGKAKGKEWGSASLPAYIDYKGDEQVTEKMSDRIIENFVSPWYTKDIKDDPVAKEVIKVNKHQDENIIFKSSDKGKHELTLDGKTINLDEHEMEDYKRIRGKANYNNVKKLMNSAEYKTMSWSEKGKAMKKEEDASKSEAKRDTLLKMGKDEWKVYTDDFSGSKKDYKAAKEAGLSAKTYFDIMTNGEKEADRSGNGSLYKSEVVMYLNSREDLTDEQREVIFSKMSTAKNPYTDGTAHTTDWEAEYQSKLEQSEKTENTNLSKAFAGATQREEGSMAAKLFNKSVIERAKEADENSGSSKGSSRRGRSGRRGGGGSGSSKRKQTASERKFANGTGKLSSVDLEKIYKQTQGKQTKLPTVDLIKIYEQAKIEPAKVPTTSLVKAYTQVQQASKTKTPTPMDIKVKGLTKSQKKAMLKVMLKKLDTKR